MKQAFCLFIAVVFLFGASVVQGNGVPPGTVQDVDCSSASLISFSIYIPDIDEWDGSADQSSWSLNSVDDESCEPEFDSANNLVKYTNINAAICDPGDPSLTSDDGAFEYKFVISVDAVADGSAAPATFAYDHNYIVKCFYNREQENIMASFEPRHSFFDSGSGTADFVITLTVHEKYSDTEVTSVIDLSTEVYGKIMITDDAGIPQDLDVHLLEVTAAGDGVDSYFTLIEDGCIESPVVTSTSCGTTSEDRFYFNIFRFPGQQTPDRVYLYAKVIVCLSDNGASVCQTQCDACNTRRKRRNTLEQVQQTEFYVKAGPFQIRDLESPNQETESAAGKDEGRTPLPAYVIAVVAVCGLLAIAIVSAVVLIVLRRRSVSTVELKNEDSVTA